MSKEGLAALHQLNNQTIAQLTVGKGTNQQLDHQAHSNAAFQTVQNKIKSDSDYSERIRKNREYQGSLKKGSERLGKYIGKSFTEIQDAMDTMEDGAEKEWLRENASRLPGWRESIRDMDVIRKEINDLTDQLEHRRLDKTEKHRRMLGAAGVHPELLTAFTPPDGEEETKLQKQIQRLQEEYEWSSYFHEQDVMENIDDYVAKAEKEYQDYTHTVKYAAWKMARDRALGQSNEVVLPGAWETDPKEEELRRNLEYYKSLQTSKKEQQMMAADLEELASWPVQDQRALMVYAANPYRDVLRTTEAVMLLGQEPEEVRLVFKYGVQRVNEIAESYMRSQTQEMTQNVSQAAAQSAGSGFWAGVGHSVVSVGANLIGSLTAPVGYLEEAARRTGRYSTLDPNNLGMLPSAYAGAVRGAVVENIEGTAAGQLGSTFYQAGMSALDNLTRIVTTGGGAASLALAATGSFGQTVSNLSQKGASPMEAVGMGIINGGLEVLTEKISLDNLLKSIDTPKNAMDIILSMFRAGGVEVTEEELSFLGSTLAEAVILREKSSYNRRIAELQMFGLTENQAKDQAARGVIDEAFQTALQSFLSGGIMSGVTSLYSNTMNRIQQNAEKKQLQETVQQATQQIQQGQQKRDPAVVMEKGVDVSAEKLETAKRISAFTGRRIVFYSSDDPRDGDGFYSDDGAIHVNDKGIDPVAQIISHELTHSVEMADTYKELSSLVLKRIEQSGGNLEQMRLEKRGLYAQNGVLLNSDADVDSEIVASYVAEYLLKDEQSITSLVREDRKLGQRIKDWLESLLAKFGNTKAQERTFIKQARDAYARALDQTGGNTSVTTSKTQTEQSDTGETGMSMEDTLEWARNMLASGEWTDAEFDKFMDQYIQHEEQQGIDGMAAEDRRFTEKKYSLQNQSDGLRTDEPSSSYQGKTLSADSEIYSYDFLTSMPDMQTVIVPSVDEVRNESGRIDTARVIDAGIKNALSIGEERAGKVYVKNRYTGRELRVDVSSIRHGLNGNMSRLLTNARLGSVIGDVIQNAIPINALHNTADGVEGTYAMAGYAADEKGREFVAIITIEQRSGNVSGIDTYDVTHAISGRQKRGNQLDTKSQGVYPTLAASKLSIKDLLTIVKGTYQSVLSDDVLGHFGESKNTDGHYYGRAKFSIKESTVNKRDVARQLQAIMVPTSFKIKKESPTAAVDMDTQSAIQGDSFNKSIAKDDRSVKRQYSISDSTVNKRDVARQLQAIIDRGGDTAELQQYVHSLRGGAGSGGKNDGKQGNTGAQQILRAAKSQGISVEEYLRQNWEQYDVDGEWNADARAALDMERRGRRKYAISEKNADMVADIEQQFRSGTTSTHGYELAGFDEGEPGVRNPSVMIRKPGENEEPVSYELSEEDNTEERIIRRAAEIIEEDYRSSQDEDESRQETQAQKKTPEEIRAGLPAKARIYLQRVESELVDTIGDKLGVTKFARRGYLKGIVQEISNEYLQNDTVSDEKINLLFDKAYAEGIVVDNEYYNQYKHIKDHLRKTAVTISARDQADIADFSTFRRDASGMLRIVNKGGLPVDSAYQELNQMAPELFPESITHPADQLQRMLDVGRSIQVSQKSLDEYYGGRRDDFRLRARNDFESAVRDIFGELRQVKRFADERNARKAKRAEISEEEAADMYRELKAARKEYEKVNAKHILTEHDEMQVGRLLRGEIQLEHLDPGTDSIKNITAVFNAKQEYEQISKKLAAYKDQQKAKYQQRAKELLETANTWVDKKTGIAYSRETMRRNVLDIVRDAEGKPDPETANQILREYFEPVQISEAMATRYKTRYRERVRELGLSQKVEKGNLVSEAHAVQLLGEAMDNIRVMEESKGRIKNRDGRTLSEWRDVVNNLWLGNPRLDKMKIEESVEEFRKIYDELFQEMNRVRVRNGYEPVNYRQGYFPHFQPGDGDGIMVHFGKALGIDTKVETLPTTINGMTQTFRPGIQWFGNAQERLGFSTAYDAVQGFDKYIEGVSNVIFHTENIQKLRALASQARYRTSKEGLRDQVDAVRADDRLKPEEKQLKIRDIYEHGEFTLSNFVVELDEYTNLLAGKKSRFDRNMEAMIGRRAYTIMKNWESRVGANMIAGNMTSAFTNFIPLTQAGARMDRGMILNGMKDTLAAIRQDDGFAAKSDFLTNRRGSDPITKAWELKSYQAKRGVSRGIYAGMQKASDWMGAPMELIDNFTSEAIVRAAYQQNLRRGLSEAEAMHQADIFAANVMADRSKGSMPTLLESKNPFFKAFTQFQLEVNNQYSEIFKDLPREYKERGLVAFGWMLLKYFLGAFLYNEVYEYFIGRRPALDPLGMLNSVVGDLTGYELPNLVEAGWNTLNGEETSFETEKVGIGGAGTNLAGEVLGALPFSAGLTMLGIETDGGRIPAASAVPDFTAIWDVATGDMTPEQRWKEIQDELNKLAYIIPPFGGNQISKIWKGVKAVKEGGSYSLDQDGKEILQYPVYNDDPEEAFWNMVRAAVFGKNSLPTAQAWTNSGFNSLNAEETAVYKDMQEAEVTDRDAYALIDGLRNADVPAGTAEEDRYSKLREIKSNMILDSNVSDEGKAIAFYGLVAYDSEKELMDQLADAGADQSGLVEFMIDLKNARGLKGDERRGALCDIIVSSSFTDEEKTIIVGDILGTEMTTDNGEASQYAKFLSAVEGGLSVDKYMELYGKNIHIDKYFDMKDMGLGTSSASEITMALAELEPEAGEDEVSWLQKCDAILDSKLSDADKLSALIGVSNESTGRKIRIGYENGVAPDVFVELKKVLPEFDANENGSYTQKEVTAAINAMSDGVNDMMSLLTGTAKDGLDLSTEQKAVLWQLQTGAKDGKSNPYDKEVGKFIYDTVQARKEEAEAEEEKE